MATVGQWVVGGEETGTHGRSYYWSVLEDKIIGQSVLFEKKAAYILKATFCIIHDLFKENCSCTEQALNFIDSPFDNGS